MTAPAASTGGASSDDVDTATMSRSDRRLMVAVGMGILLGALDGAIIATILPRIAAELNGVSIIAWIAGAYLFGTAVAVPGWGSLGDLKGHRFVLACGLAIMLIGSLGCGAAGLASLPFGAGLVGAITFAVSRLIQGVGSGAVFSAGFALVADVYPARRRARGAGTFAMVFAMATLAGPLVGAGLGSTALRFDGISLSGWRLIFLGQLPALIVAMLLIGSTRHDPKRYRHGAFDLAGLAALAILMLAAIAGLQALHGRGFGAAARWSMVFAIAAVALIVIERRAAEPLLPGRLMRLPVLRAAALAGLASSAALLCAATAIPLMLQHAGHFSLAQTGIVMTCFSIGIAIGAVTAGRWVARTGDCPRPVMLGCVVATGGMVVLCVLPINPAISAGALLIVGVGLGPMQASFTLLAQHVAPTGQSGTAGGIVQFFRRIGATIGGATGAIVGLGGPAAAMPANGAIVAILTGGFLAIVALTMFGIRGHRFAD